MLFYTPEFLIFSVILLAMISVVHRDQARKVVLLVASYVFYMWWNPAFILLIAFATLVNFLAARAIANESRDGRRKVILIGSLVASLGLLGYFKYAGFLAENTLYLARMC